MMTRSRDKIATVAQLGKQAHDRKLKLNRNTKMSENPKIFIFETFFKSASNQKKVICKLKLWTAAILNLCKLTTFSVSKSWRLFICSSEGPNKQVKTKKPSIAIFLFALITNIVHKRLFTLSFPRTLSHLHLTPPPIPSLTDSDHISLPATLLQFPRNKQLNFGFSTLVSLGFCEHSYSFICVMDFDAKIADLGGFLGHYVILGDFPNPIQVKSFLLQFVRGSNYTLTGLSAIFTTFIYHFSLYKFSFL
ncbi:hypothetical protein GQR58_025118 [Nymphon striatum]|nr:hypothetical protein GQR58_025118 [Nymphon striatum]